MGRAITLVAVLVASNLALARLAANHYDALLLQVVLVRLHDRDNREVSNAISLLMRPNPFPLRLLRSPYEELSPRDQFLLGAHEAQGRSKAGLRTNGDHFILLWMWFSEDSFAKRASDIKKDMAAWDSSVEETKGSFPRRYPAERQLYLKEHIRRRNCVASIAGLMEAREGFVQAFYQYWTHTLTALPNDGVARASQNLKRMALEHGRAITEFEASGCDTPVVGFGHSFEPDEARQVVQDVLRLVDQCGDAFDRLSRTAIQPVSHGFAFRPWKDFVALTDTVCKGR